ncbi:hypothetical protein AB9F39_38295, partial [Rhizobium leguminosarum]
IGKMRVRFDRQELELPAIILAELGDLLDWAYIDTDHSFELTWQELLICEKKVKRTGRIAGHDFCTGNKVKPIVYGVVEEV